MKKRRRTDKARSLSPGHAASLLTAGATAWNAVRTALDGKYDGTLGKWEGGWTRKRLEGQWALTLGTGGVSSFAIQVSLHPCFPFFLNSHNQILSTLGATVISTSSSDAKLAIAKSLGAAHTINYAEHPEWHEEVLKITGGRGVDHVIDVGGAGTLLKSIKSVRQGGLVSVLGVLSKEGTESGVAAEVLFRAITGKRIRLLRASGRKGQC